MMTATYYLFIGIFASVQWMLGAAAPWRWQYGTSPDEVLDRIVGEANATVKIQDTQLDKVTDAEWQFATKYKITNTLDSLRMKVAPYLQWFIYIGLAVATILLIITGFEFVVSWQTWQDTKKLQWRIKNIIIGIVVLTWFYVIARIFTSLIAYFLK